MSKHIYTIVTTQTSKHSHAPIVEVLDYKEYETATKALDSLHKDFNAARGWDCIQSSAHKIAFEKEATIFTAQLVQRADYKA